MSFVDGKRCAEVDTSRLFKLDNVLRTRELRLSMMYYSNGFINQLSLELYARK